MNTINKETFKLIAKIAQKADGMNLLMFDRLSLIMDLEQATKEFDLRLNDFLNADSLNFSHDICGIQNNLNRQTKKFENCFTPRFSSAK